MTLGYTDLLLDRHPRGDADYENLQEIRRATNRGASLTRQLLAFGHKHDARRERVDLACAVADLRDILRRLIREDIALEIHVPDHPIAIVADPHDVERIVLNLVLNARDALLRVARSTWTSRARASMPATRRKMSRPNPATTSGCACATMAWG